MPTEEEINHLAGWSAGEARGRTNQSKLWLVGCDNQYAMCDLCPNQMFKVLIGSGMGIRHSSELADTTFYMLHDKDNISRSVLDDHGINGYWRFKDDILVLGSSKEGANTWFQRFKASPEPVFTMKCVQFSKKVEYLDPWAEISDLGIKTVPRTKVSNLDVPPLQEDSCHNPSVHKSWPRNLLFRKLNLCMDSVSKHEVRILQTESCTLIPCGNRGV